ncbi:MAG: hypothetical protein AAB966_04045 [Patescibacteria group bacterium]
MSKESEISRKPQIDAYPASMKPVSREIPHHVKKVFFAGASGVGKSTVIGRLDVERVHVVPRFTTFPRRSDSLPWENIHLNPWEFDMLELDGTIEVSWNRDMGNGDVVKYGFPVRNDDDSRIAVYPTNSLFFDHMIHMPPGFLDGALIVGVFAPNIVRTIRLQQRSPDMPTHEREARLSDNPQSVVNLSHVVVNNYGSFEKCSSEDVMDFIARIS